MDAVSIKELYDLFSNFGVVGAVAIIWYWESRRFQRMFTTFEKRHEELFSMFEKRHEELSSDAKEKHNAVVRMYENNVLLVQNYEKLATDLKDVVALNSQGFQRTFDAIENNRFCPVERKRRMEDTA